MTFLISRIFFVFTKKYEKLLYIQLQDHRGYNKKLKRYSFFMKGRPLFFDTFQVKIILLKEKLQEQLSNLLLKL